MISKAKQNWHKMYSVGKLKKMIIIEATDHNTNEAYGYFFDARNRIQRRKFHFRIQENGRPEISKPTAIKRKDYEAILNKVGDGRGRTFTEIEEMYGFREGDTEVSA
jgi:hypothetical protein